MAKRGKSEVKVAKILIFFLSDFGLYVTISQTLLKELKYYIC
jgi:hypothetical protein